MKYRIQTNGIEYRVQRRIWILCVYQWETAYISNETGESEKVFTTYRQAKEFIQEQYAKERRENNWWTVR